MVTARFPHTSLLTPHYSHLTTNDAGKLVSEKVRQYERWGPIFPFLYLLSSAAALVCGLDPYRDNRFEQEAFRVSGLSKIL